MNKKGQRGRPRTKPAAFPLQAEKMKQVFAFLVKMNIVKNQKEMAPLFGLNATNALNRLYRGEKPLNDRHKEFFALKTGIRPEWWDNEGAPIEKFRDTSRISPGSNERSSWTKVTAETEMMMKFFLGMRKTIQNSLASLSPNTESEPFWQALREIDVLIGRAQHAAEELDVRGRDMTDQEHEQALDGLGAIKQAIDTLISLAKTARGEQADFYRSFVTRNKKSQQAFEYQKGTEHKHT